MLREDSDWFKRDGASTKELERLKSVCEIQIPVELLDLLAYSNGGEGPLPVQPYNFCLDSVETIEQNLSDMTFDEFFSGFLVFGGNGGGELIAIDTRAEQNMPIVALDMTNIDISESRMIIADSFAEFLDLIGRQEE